MRCRSVALLIIDRTRNRHDPIRAVFEWVDATLSLNPPDIENKKENRLPGLDDPERCPGEVLGEYGQTDGSPAQALPNQRAG